MATKVLLIDDLDGTEAFRTVRFMFDNETFEIDLSREHFDSFKHGLEPWMKAGRHVSKEALTRPPASPSDVAAAGRKPNQAHTPASQRTPARPKEESLAIRAWARENGYPDIPKSGIIKKEIIKKYKLAHPTPAPDWVRGRDAA